MPSSQVAADNAFRYNYKFLNLVVIMPIYEYRCAGCGFQKEFLQKMSDAPLKDCPECGKPTLNKMVTAAGFQLKGSGWYVTDFRSGSKAPAKADDKSPDNAAAGTDTKSEVKTPAGQDGKTPAKVDEKAAAKPSDKPAVDSTAKKADPAPSSKPPAKSTGT